MKKKFTFLIAAIAAILLITQPMKVMGQSYTEVAKFESSSVVTAGTYAHYYNSNWDLSYGGNNVSVGTNKNNYSSCTISSAYGTDANTSNNAVAMLSKNMLAKISKITFTFSGGSGYGGKIYLAYSTDNSTWDDIELSSGTQGSTATTDMTFTFDEIASAYYVVILDRGNKTNSAWRWDNVEITFEKLNGPVTYNVTYNAGSGTGDPVVDNNGGTGYTSGTSYTVKANTGDGCPNFTKTGYRFSAWYDNAGLTGTAYGPGDGQTHSFSITGNTNLYAEWNINQYNVAVSSINNVTLTATYGGSNTIAENNNTNLEYGTTVTLSATNLAENTAFNWQITKTTGGDDVTNDVLDGTTLTVPDYDITIGGQVVSVYSVTYNCNGGTSGCPDPATISNIASGTSITLAAAPTKTGNVFMGWNDGANTYAAGASYTVTGNKTLTAQWAVGASGEIKFGTNDVKINSTSVSADDNLSKNWTITTVGTSNFTQNAAYSQIGASSAKGDSITFAMNLGTPPSGYTYQIISFEAKFGGFSGDAGTITLRVGDTKVGTGSLDGTNDVTVNNNINATGSNLKVSVVNKGNLRCKAYYIKYTYAQIALTPVTITFNGHGGTYNSGSTYTQDVYSGIPATLNANQFVRSNYAFTNWSTDQDGTGDTYNDGANITVNANTTLYAQWQAAYTATVGGISNGTVKIVVNETEYTEKQFVAGAEVNLSCVANNGYRFSAWNVKAADNSDVTVTNNKFTMPAQAVTISATFVQATTYQLVTNVNQIVSGKHYVIANGKNSTASEVTVQAMGAQSGSGSSRSKVDVKVTNNTITENPNIAMCEFVINGTTIVTKDQVNYSVYTIYDKQYSNNTGGYLYAASSSNNQLLTETSVDNNNNCRWTIDIITDNNAYKATIKARGSNSRNYLLNNTNNNIFSCYSGTSNQVDDNIYLYVKTNDTNLEFFTPSVFSGETTISGTVSLTENTAITVENGAVVTFTGTLTNTNANYLTIENGGQLILGNSNTGVKATVKKSTTASEEKTSNAWYAIASPVDGVAIESFVQGEKYNVYRYDETEAQWEEYRDGSNEFTTLANGRGYLYRSTAADIEFAGDVNVGSVTFNSTSDYPLTYTTSMGNLKGFHLLGNPFTHDITWSNLTTKTNISDAGYYLLDVNDGWSATPTKGTIAPMQGFLVQATVASPVVTISNTAGKGENANHDNLMFRVENSEYSDVTYAMFDKGYGLTKINHRNSEIPMLYIPQNGEDYSIAMMSDDTKAFNLNFKAMTTGKYTLSYKADGNFGYLHVIDRLTGEDVDMLLNNEYEFVASKNDNANRFIVRLAYSAISENSEDDIFAYQNGSDIVVTGEGELQIFDVMGRMIASQHVNGVETINVKSQGVYIFRLNGMTQKIVVR